PRLRRPRSHNPTARDPDDNHRGEYVETTARTARQGQRRRAPARIDVVSSCACIARTQERSRPRRSCIDRAYATAGRPAEGSADRDRGARHMNAFLEFAEKQTPAAVKARQRAAEKRRATAAQKAAEKVLAERDDLFRLWRQWRRERLERLLA